METLLENPVVEKNGVNEKFKHEPTRNIFQYAAAASASLAILISGTILGWTSPTLPRLEDPNSTFPISADQGSWIGSLAAFGAIFGPFPAGIFADLIGRKKALLASAAPFMVSWILLAAADAQSVILMYAGRVISGLANGWAMTILPMYVGEIATPNARGAMGVIGQIMITFGFLYVFSIGPFVSYLVLCIACSVLPVVFFVFFLFAPESPFYEVKKNNHKAAVRCLRKLRGKSSEGVKEELNALQIAVDESLRNTGTWVDLFTGVASRRAIFLMCSLMAIQQLSGINVVLFYSETIFINAGSSLPGSIATILVGIVQFLASFGAPYLIEKLGRRIVLIISSVGMMMCQAVIGTCFYVETLGYDVPGLIPVLCIIGYIIVYSVGIGPVPWAMIGEMFAPNIRSKGAALTAAFSWFLAFLMTKFFGTIVEMLGNDTGFWLFATCCGLGALFVFFMLPETKGKTLEEIQDMLNSK